MSSKLNNKNPGKIIANNASGFTLVEIAIVIVVIAILTTISVISYGAWRKNTAESAVKSDLRNVAATMDDERNFNNKYPESIPDSYGGGDNTDVVLGWSDASKFCISGTSRLVDGVAFRVQENGVIDEGVCSVPPPNAPVLASVKVVGATAQLTWSHVDRATGYDVRKKLSSSSTWESSKTSNSSSYSYAGLTLNKRYDYQIRAVGESESSSWSNIITRVTIAKPTNMTVALKGCGNNGGVYSWMNGDVSWQSVPNDLAPRYKLYGSTHVDNNYTNGGSHTVRTRSTDWQANKSGSGTFSVTGIGPDGEESEAATWTTPIYSPYEC